MKDMFLKVFCDLFSKIEREKDRELEETGWKRPAHTKEAIRGGKIRLEWGTDGLIKERKIRSKIQSG